VRQQSLYDLKDEVDICFSIGVIHHFNLRLLAVSNMCRAVKADSQPSTCSARWSALGLLLRIGLRPIEYFRLRTFPFSHLHHIVLDQMLPKVANYWSRDHQSLLS
jgi:hypothetical protein